ncbi:MAG: hypothetical protein ACI8TP_003057 [Acidimicrobiales bacterium]|jgi:hypothetical protein
MCGRSNSVSPAPMPGQSPTRWNVIFQPTGSNTLAAVLHVGEPEALEALVRRLINALGQRSWVGDDELVAELVHHMARTSSELVPLSVELDWLGEALDQPVSAESFIDVADGSLWPAILFEDDQGPADFDPSFDRWLPVVGQGSPPKYEVMQRFVATIEQPDLASRLSDALVGSAAFRKFQKALSRNESEYTRWHRFSDDARLGRARNWLADHGYRSHRPQP